MRAVSALCRDRVPVRLRARALPYFGDQADLLVATNRIFALVTASQIASASDRLGDVETDCRNCLHAWLAARSELQPLGRQANIRPGITPMALRPRSFWPRSF